MEQRDVLILCQFFYPEYNSSATLSWDTAKHLAKLGLKVCAMCGYPKEYSNGDKVAKKEIKEGVVIKRIHYLQLNRKKTVGRLINFFSFTVAMLFHICEFRKYKCIIVYSNPPILPIVAILANIWFGTKIVFVSYDVYPEIAYASSNIAKNGFIARFMEIINRELFERVSAVITLTDEMKEFLIKNRSYLDECIVKVIPNWAHETKTTPTDAAFKKYGFEKDDFIVSYFGNMGICQDVETLIQAMGLLKESENIKFFIAGQGVKQKHVIEMTKDLKNVHVFDFLKGKEFEQAIAISSCGIVSLEKGLKGLCAPSKYYSYLQGGIPVIAIVERGSYMESEIETEKIGYAIMNGDGYNLAYAIERLASYKEERIKIGNRSSKLYEKKYLKKDALDSYAEIIRDVLNN